MIPYYQPPSLHLGPIPIEIFGVFVLLGIWVGTRLAAGRAARQGLDGKVIVDFIFWGALSGIFFGHLVHVVAYKPEDLANPLNLLKFWDGLSSFGGLLGGVVAAVVYFRVRKLRFMDYADALALGTAPGWGIARIGCFAVHDHPGLPSDFFLAVAFPGGSRHDLGLYDALWLFAITVVLYALAKRQLLTGRLLGVLAILYAFGRFGFDFLRTADARYLGLTPAQYFCFLLVAWGGYVIARGPRPKAPSLATPPTET